jgi:hypothetical protein
MLSEPEDEVQQIKDQMSSHAPDLTMEFYEPLTGPLRAPMRPKYVRFSAPLPPLATGRRRVQALAGTGI